MMARISTEPRTFTMAFVHFQHMELITDVFAGRIYGRQLSPQVIGIRKILKRQEGRERSYEQQDLYSMSIGSRFHPERAPIWEPPRLWKAQKGR